MLALPANGVALEVMSFAYFLVTSLIEMSARPGTGRRPRRRTWLRKRKTFVHQEAGLRQSR